MHDLVSAGTSAFAGLHALGLGRREVARGLHDAAAVAIPAARSPASAPSPRRALMEHWL